MLCMHHVRIMIACMKARQALRDHRALSLADYLERTQLLRTVQRFEVLLDLQVV